MLNPLVAQALKNLLSKGKITQVGDRYFAGIGLAPICARCHARIKKDEKILVDKGGNALHVDQSYCRRRRAARIRSAKTVRSPRTFARFGGVAAPSSTYIKRWFNPIESATVRRANAILGISP